MDTSTAIFIASSTEKIGNDVNLIFIVVLLVATVAILDFVRRFLMPSKL